MVLIGLWLYLSGRVLSGIQDTDAQWKGKYMQLINTSCISGIKY